jgi:lipopolysaccharide/colanic/teichoic acid biosynthesis glycosyltransferase
MYVDAEKRLPELLDGDAAARDEYERYARITRDPRVTPIGRFLRRFSLDELPQLWNVLRGDMALVGPRPYLPDEAGKVGAYLDTIVRVRPGMTGLWQVSGRAELPFRERNVLDEYYIRNWSLWMDLSIVVRTLRAVTGGRGAY